VRSRGYRLIAIGLLLLVGPRNATAQDAWLLAGVQVPVVHPVSLRITGFLLNDVELRGGWAELRTRVAPWLMITPALLHSTSTDDDVKLTEWRPRIDATMAGSALGVTFASRTMLERRHVTSGPADQRSRLTMLRARLRTELQHPIHRITPFVMAEAFDNLTEGRYVRSWLSAGLSLGTRHLLLEPAYFRRLERDGPDGDAVMLTAIWFP
jgi:hypothetical protein